MKEELKKYMHVNLQLFAGPDEDEEEEIDDGGYSGDEEEEIEDTKVDGDEIGSEEETENEDSTEKEEEPKQLLKQQKDKKDYAIIKAKQEAKQLRDELAKIKKADEERKAAEQREKLKQKFIDNGFTEEEATDRANEKAKVEKLEMELKSIKYNSQADKLSQKFPDIFDNLDKLIDICEKTGWPLEKVAKAELDESSEYDIKTKTEQEALLRRQKATEKKVEPGSTKASKQIKLSSQDERAYQIMIKSPKYKGLTRTQYLEILKEEE